MNSSDICHQLPDCPGLFVDAFRGHFLREHTKNPNATFVLSHYHGDHYTQLPRDHKYRGPAKIHCTPITARLLIDVHLVSKDFVVEHEYGKTFRHNIVRQSKGEKASDTYANITFYDANHCPGACIILIELPESKTVHLHTGDMRYHPRFRSYPLLAQSTLQRRLDLVYLDTTYCHPKHDFLAQDDAVDSIASQTQELLSGKSPKTLVLLSCYSIGKEKVLYEASKRSKQQIYVSEKKWKMLRCIQQQQDDRSAPDEKEEKSSSVMAEHHTNILERCTRDPSASDLHVIPMGLAGEMWPYFQPNFQKLAKYVEDLSPEINENEIADQGQPPKKYDKVVAFIPTGWADASNWNKKNAISTKAVKLSSSRSLHVEVRLISYSEHSTFPELVSFVQFLKPRKVIPTVYSDASHKRQIEGRFRNMLDSNRAKQAFFRSMTKKRSSFVPIAAMSPKKEDLASFSIVEGNDHAEICSKGSAYESNCDTRSYGKNHMFENDESKVRLQEDAKENIDEVEVVRVVVPSKKSVVSSNIKGSTQATISNDKLDTIVSMGFDRYRAQKVLEKCHGNMERAIHEILLPENNIPTNGGDSPPTIQHQGIDTKPESSHATSITIKKRKISDFFGQRK